MQNFPTRESYLAWRAERRATYKTLSANLRQTKIDMRTTMRAFPDAGAPTLQHNLLSLRAEAREIMAQRVEAKKLGIVLYPGWQAAEAKAAQAKPAELAAA